MAKDRGGGEDRLCEENCVLCVIYSPDWLGGWVAGSGFCGTAELHSPFSDPATPGTILSPPHFLKDGDTFVKFHP